MTNSNITSNDMRYLNNIRYLERTLEDLNKRLKQNNGDIINNSYAKLKAETTWKLELAKKAS